MTSTRHVRMQKKILNPKVGVANDTPREAAEQKQRNLCKIFRLGKKVLGYTSSLITVVVVIWRRKGPATGGKYDLASRRV